MGMQDLLIVGAGRFAREVYHWTKDAFSANAWSIKGFLSKDHSELLAYGIDIPLLGDEENYRITSTDRFLLGIGEIDIKMRVVNNLLEKEAQFVSLIHPTALVVDTARVGRGVIICPHALVSDNAGIDEFAMMNFFSSCAHDAHIGARSVLSPYATLGGGACIEEDVFLGTHASVAPGRVVGRGSKVSANSVVMRDVPPGSLVVGVPGKHHRIYFDA